jgi:hypothetical protein
MMGVTMAGVNRTVRFNAIVDVGGDEEYIWDDFPAEDLLREADALGVYEEGRLALRGNAFLIAQRVPAPTGATALVMYKVTQQDLPMLFNSETGEIRPLEDVLGDEAVDIAEPTYFVFFDGGVVGYVYNHFGPRPRHLEMYVGYSLNFEIEVRPIPRTDVLEALNAAGEVSLIRFKVPTRVLGAVTEDNILSETRNLAEILPGTEVEVIVRARGFTGRQRLASAARATLPRLVSGQRAALRKLKVKLGVDEDYRGDAELDLLEEHIVVEREIETVTGRRYLAPSDAVQTIVAAFDDLRDSIERGLEAGA